MKPPTVCTRPLICLTRFATLVGSKKPPSFFSSTKRICSSPKSKPSPSKKHSLSTMENLMIWKRLRSSCKINSSPKIGLKRRRCTHMSLVPQIQAILRTFSTLSKTSSSKRVCAKEVSCDEDHCHKKTKSSENQKCLSVFLDYFVFVVYYQKIMWKTFVVSCSVCNVRLCGCV